MNAAGDRWLYINIDLGIGLGPPGNKKYLNQC